MDTADVRSKAQEIRGLVAISDRIASSAGLDTRAVGIAGMLAYRELSEWRRFEPEHADALEVELRGRTVAELPAVDAAETGERPA